METHSPQTDEIIAQVRAVVAGTASREALRVALSAHRDQVLATREAFSQSATDDNLPILTAEIQAVMVAYDAYLQAVDALSIVAAEEAEEAIARLIAATKAWSHAVEAYQAKHFTTGPTEFAELNKLIHFVYALHSRKLDADSFKQVLADSRAYTEKCLQSSHEADPPEATELLRQGMARHVEGLAELEQFLQDGNDLHLHDGLQIVERAQRLIKRSDEVRREQSPTPSPATNRLLVLCREVQKGKSEFALLPPALQARLAAVGQEYTAFKEEASGYVPSDADGYQARLAEVHRAFEAYLAALQTLAHQATLMQGVDQLQEAAVELYWAYQDYSAFITTDGPTRYPSLNRLLSTMDAIRKAPDAAPAEHTRLPQLLAAARQEMQQWLQQTAAVPAEESVVAGLRAGFGGLLEALDEVEKYQQDRNPQHLETCEARIKLAHEPLQSAFESLMSHQEPGPTASPIANAFLLAVDRLKAGKFSTHEFERQLSAFDEYLVTVRDEMTVLEQVHRETPRLQQEVMRMQQAVALHEQANSAFHRYLDGGKLAQLDAGRALLVEAMRRFHEAYATLHEMTVRQGQLACPRCASLNELHHRFCTNCKSPLPRVETPPDAEQETSTFAVTEVGGLEGSAQPTLTENTKRVLEAARMVLAGTISTEEFSATLDWMEEQIQHGRDRVVPLPAVDETQLEEMQQRDPELRSVIKLAADAMQLFIEGTGDFDRALEEMRLYLGDKDAEHLKQGSRMVWDASRDLQQARHVGELLAARSQELRQRQPDPWSPEEDATTQSGAVDTNAVRERLEAHWDEVVIHSEDFRV